MQAKRVMVFGTFDGVHEGHRAFLREAKHYGDYLIAVVTPDHLVRHLKGKEPRADVSERMRMLEEEDGIDEAVAGDEELASWEIVKRYRPDVIALGYDQHALKENLETDLMHLDFHPEIKVLRAHQPEKYHNALL